MSLTIVTVALNAAEDLPLTIESVVHQDFKDIEYLVVDGGSWDSTYQVLERYQDCADRIVTLEDAGIYHAMNEAAKLASGEYILFLNAGDRLYSERAISRMFSRLDGKPDIFYGDHIYCDGRIELLKRSAEFSWIRKKLLSGNVDNNWHSRIPGHQATFTRTTLLRDRPFDTRYSICADHDFLLRACDEGARMQYIDQIVSHYIGGGLSSRFGERLRHEWALAYRARSLRPREVDKLILGASHEFPFPSHNSFSGVIVSGAHGEEGPTPEFCPSRFRWCGILEMVTPSSRSASGLRVTGINNHKGQFLSAIAQDREVGGVELAVGPFDVTIGFSEELRPASSLVLRPERVQKLSGNDLRQAGFALIDYQFVVPEEAPRAPIGVPVHVTRNTEELWKGMLQHGWSSIETQHGHVWSISERCGLTIAADAAPSEVILYLRANPHVRNGQRVTVRLNDDEVESFGPITARGEPTPVRIPINGGWSSTGCNFVNLTVDKMAKPPTDSRTLGVALCGLELR
jgi:GT2 family glycosyltransferase